MSCGSFTEEVMAPTLSGSMNRSSLYSQREGGMQPKRLGRAVSLHEGNMPGLVSLCMEWICN